MIFSKSHKPLTLTGLIFIFLFSGTGFCAEGTEYQIKAAMILNFIKFVQWPAQSADQFPDQLNDLTNPTITIGIFGKDNFGNTLDQIEGRKIGNKQLSVRHIKSMNQLSGCQILFVSASDSHRTYQILREISGMPVLTIGEDEDFIRLGGIIRFYSEKNHIRFEVNQTAALKSDLKLSVKLLEVAAAIH
jgi:hypothetical protein